MTRTREAVAVALAGLVIIAAYAWSGQLWVDLVDEGYFLDLGERVLHGQLPYRDFTTYYTPGIFYLFALVFKVFGTSLLPIRVLMACLRGALFVLLYRLTRRVAPWPFAVLPFLIVAAIDAWPIEPEPHPSWPAVVFGLVTLEFVVRHLCSAQRRWLVTAGAAAAVAYVFKQNVGAFAALGVAGYVLLRPGGCENPRSLRSEVSQPDTKHSDIQSDRRLPTGRVERGMVATYVAGVVGLITWIMWSYLDALFAGGLLAPVILALGVLASRAWQYEGMPLQCWLKDGAAAATGFATVTLGWLVPLTVALGPGQTPLGLFVGEVDQAAIASPFGRFTAGVPPLLLAAIWVPAVLMATKSAGCTRRTITTAVLLSAVVLVLPTWQGARDELTRDPLFAPTLNALDGSFGTLHLYLPSMAVWAGVAGLLLARTSQGPYPWFVLFGALGALTMYPRADTLHAVVSSPLALVGGAAALARLHCWLAPLGRWQHRVIMAALLCVPLAAVAPQLVWRAATLVSPEGDTGRRLDYAALDLRRAPVLVPRHQAEALNGAVTYIRARTPEDEPLFAYPVAPLFNFLAERPNPTHFDHFLPGTLTSNDFEQVITDLQRARPRYVVWDHLGVTLWDTDPANRVLSDYIWTCYDQVATFRLYLVLERRADGVCAAYP